MRCRLTLVCSSVALAIAVCQGAKAANPTYGDGDASNGIFSILGGLEQSYLSSQANETDGFVYVFSKVNFPSGNWTISPWAVVRDIGSPSQNSDQNLVSAVTNPDGTISSSSLSSIGYSVDFLFGGDFQHFIGSNQQWSMGPIFAFGATTPISSTSATVGFAVPSLGTEECAQLQQRFASTQAYNLGYLKDLVAGTPAGSNTSCLFNAAGTTPGTSGTTTPNSGTAVSTLAFAGINRSNFFEKWEFGARMITREYTKTDGSQTTCSGDPNTYQPCSRGMVDLTVGQDAAITGGAMRHLVFKADATVPFPYAPGGWIVIFASTALRLSHDTDLPPLVLSPASSSTLQSIPSPSIFVEPYMQPNKDFYRIGVAIDFVRLMTNKKS